MFVPAGAADGSRANLLCDQMGAQARVMWLDAEANLRELSSRSLVARTMRQCREANINTVIVDVKPLSGLVLYKSRLAPRLTRSGDFSYPRGYDLLRTVLEEGHKNGIAVHAAVNVFSEGSQILPGGPAFRHPDWQCVRYEMRRTLVADDGTSVDIRVANAPYVKGQICLYGESSKSAGELPPGTVYLRVGADGTPLFCETVFGRPRLSAPEGGYVLVAGGKQGEWLKQVAENKTRLRLSGEGQLVRLDNSTNVHNAVFVNPLHPEVRKYALSIAREICRNYPVDGFVLDRMRYPNIYADFSDLTRQAFEQYIGRKVEKWPEDVLTIDLVPGDEVTRGPLFKEWVRFRAQVMRDFLAEARKVVKSARPTAQLGIYVGSWYPLYYDVGVNWGSPNHSADLDWWPEGYEQTGYADLVDYMCTGCYYYHPTRRDAIAAGDEEWKSVEAACEESVAAVKDATFVYAGLYLLQYSGRPDNFLRAIQVCLDKTQGCMFFDLVYVRDYGWWDELQKAFPRGAKAPHDVPGLLSRVRNGSTDQASR